LLDAITLEKLGIPTVPIITDVFHGAASEMAKLWGVPGFRFVSMPHPLANLSAETVAERADALTEKVLALLQEGQPT
jgi:hypothetical protein